MPTFTAYITTKNKVQKRCHSNTAVCSRGWYTTQLNNIGFEGLTHTAFLVGSEVLPLFFQRTTPYSLHDNVVYRRFMVGKHGIDAGYGYGCYFCDKQHVLSLHKIQGVAILDDEVLCNNDGTNIGNARMGDEMRRGVDI